MKKTALLVAILAFMCGLNGCLYANIKAPLDIDAVTKPLLAVK